MNLLLSLWIIWISSEIVLAFFLRAKKSKNNYDKSSLKIIWITISISITSGAFLQNTPYIITTSSYYILYYAGIVLVILGLVIRWIAILKLRSFFTVNVNFSEGQKLVETGIYKYIRHPAYLGSLLSFIGLGIIFNNWLTACIIILPIFFVRVRIVCSPGVVDVHVVFWIKSFASVRWRL